MPQRRRTGLRGGYRRWPLRGICTAYVALWRAAAGVICVLVLAVAAVAWTIPGFVLTYTVMSVAAALVLAGVHDLPHTAAVEWNRLLGQACIAGAGLTALVALMQLSVALTVGAAFMAAVTSPPFFQLVRWGLVDRPSRRARPGTRWATALGRPPAVPGSLAVNSSALTTVDAWDWAGPVDDAVLAGLTSGELCRAWQMSYAVLHEAPGSEARAAIAGCRQRYLDELERRDARGVHDWLQAGAPGG